MLCGSALQVGFVWPNVVLFMSKHCFHYGFARWLRLRKLASFAENVRDDCTPEPSQSPVRRIAGITISSPHTSRKSPTQQAAPGFDLSSKGCSFIHESRFVGKQNLLSKICSAVPEIAVAVAA